MLRPTFKAEQKFERQPPEPAFLPSHPGAIVSQKFDPSQGQVRVFVQLINIEDLTLFKEGLLPAENIRQQQVEFLVNTNFHALAINERLRNELGLRTIDRRSLQLATGEIVQCDLVAVETRFANRRSLQNAWVLPGDAEPLFGMIPMESLDVVVEVETLRLIVNPKHPMGQVVALKTPFLR